MLMYVVRTPSVPDWDRDGNLTLPYLTLPSHWQKITLRLTALFYRHGLGYGSCTRPHAELDSMKTSSSL